MAEAASIELPEGDPGAVADVAVWLEGMAGIFEGVAETVGGAAAQVGSWEGLSAAAFLELGAGYERVALAAAGSVGSRVVAVRRFEQDLAEARERVERLRGEERECVERIELWERRLEDALERAEQARGRAAEATLGAALGGDGLALAEAARAQRELEEAEADAERARRALDREREELDRLREEAEKERTRAVEAEQAAAQAVSGIAAELQSFNAPGSPALYSGGASYLAAGFGDGWERGSREAFEDALGDAGKGIGGFLDALGKELSGYNDAKEAKEAAERGDEAGAGLHGLLALPFGLGKIGKGIKKGGGALKRKLAGDEGAKQAGKVPKAAPRGQLSIRNWDGYPEGIPKPTGELRLLGGAEYEKARAAANQANAALRRADPEAYRGKQIHEIHPVKFGGSPTDPANKIALTPQEHYRLNAFWRRRQRYAEGGS